MTSDFLEDLQFNISSTSVGASTARRMGPPGTIKVATSYLRELDLRRFRSRSSRSFSTVLDQVTEELMVSLPAGGQYWGSSRKFVNIFLRKCVYNRYVCEHYRLAKIEPWLEVPLDSQVARHLKQAAGRGKLPRWKTVIGLTPQVSDHFQQFASELACQHKRARVHLDIKFWRAAPNTSSTPTPTPRRGAAQFRC